jgi:hypothetical protein
MATIDTHIEDCMRLIGAPFEKVHRWLDQYAKKFNPHTHLEYHRKFLHHKNGVKRCGELFGPLGERAAKIHIIRDVELYVLSKQFRDVMGDEIDELYEKALKYCHPACDVKEIEGVENER